MHVLQGHQTISVCICKHCYTFKKHYMTIILQLVPCVVLTIFTGILVKVLYQVGVLFFPRRVKS